MTDESDEALARRIAAGVAFQREELIKAQRRIRDLEAELDAERELRRSVVCILDP